MMQLAIGNLIVLAALLGCRTVSSLDAPSVTISQGTVTGAYCSGKPDAVYYKSIPYAEPPLGELRFKPPKPLVKFPSGSIDATKEAPACIQWSDTFRERTPDSEDCLLINVWTPAGTTASSGLPVRVFIYGGGNEDGGISNPFFESCNVVRNTNAIQVTINFRLGAFAWLALKDAGIQGNQGIQDMLLGLQWVQDNIAAFGGDPKKVVLYGQSAGAIDMLSIVTLPYAPKLISAAVFESGGGRDSPLRSSMEALSAKYAELLGCSPSDLSCLSNKPLDELTSVYSKIPDLDAYKIGALAVKNISSPRFGPCVDGEIISKQPSLESVKVPSILGTVATEGSILSYSQYLGSPNGPADASTADYEQFLKENFGAAASQVEQKYPLSDFESNPFPPPYYAMAKIATDADYLCNVHRSLEAGKKAGVPVWTYIFTHKPKCNWTPGFSQESVKIVGAGHSVDLPFVFGHTTNLPSPDGDCDMTDEEKGISKFLIDVWTSMAENQKPVANPADWPEWDPEKSLGVAIESPVVPGLVDYSICEFWDEVRELSWKEAGISGDGIDSSGAAAGGGGDQFPFHESL